jgi:hypothetical protein
VDYYHTLGTHEERVLNANPTFEPLCDSSFPGSNPLDPRCVAGAGTRLMDLAFQTAGVALGDPTLTAGRFAQIYEYSTNNRSMCDGINFQLRKRASHHLMFQINDTVSWSRSWGGFPVASYGGSGLAVTPQQQFAPNEFARTNFDERNRFVISGVFDLSHGFQLSPIFQASSGRPYSFLTGGPDVDGDGRRTLDRVCVGGTLSSPLYPTDQNGTPEGCTMIKPNTLTGKPFIQMNLRASKSISFNEHAKLWLYGEFFNLV